MKTFFTILSLLIIITTSFFLSLPIPKAKYPSVVTLTLTQIRGGASGNTTITDTLSSVTPTNFAGGIDYGATATLAFSNAPTAEEIITLTSATGTTKTYTCKSANSAAATATLVFTNAPVTDEVITIISTDGTSITYKCRGTPDLANNYFSRLADDHGAGGTTGLKAAIEHANGHNGKITVSLMVGINMIRNICKKKDLNIKE